MTVLATYNNVSIPKNQTDSPAVAVPAGLNEFMVSMSRENWPTQCDVTLLASFDGGATFVAVEGPLTIPAFVPSTKQPTPTPAMIGYNPTVDAYPTHIKGRANNPGSRFTTTITLSGD